jgi:hypothetical protein
MHVDKAVFVNMLRLVDEATRVDEHRRHVNVLGLINQAPAR